MPFKKITRKSGPKPVGCLQPLCSSSACNEMIVSQHLFFSGIPAFIAYYVVLNPRWAGGRYGQECVWFNKNQKMTLFSVAISLKLNIPLHCVSVNKSICSNTAVEGLRVFLELGIDGL